MEESNKTLTRFAGMNEYSSSTQYNLDVFLCLIRND